MIQKYYQNEPKFKGVHSRNNLSNIVKDRAYVVNLDEHKSIGTLWITLYAMLVAWNILIDLVSNTFQKKSKNLLATKISQEISSENRPMSQ